MPSKGFELKRTSDNGYMSTEIDDPVRQKAIEAEADREFRLEPEFPPGCGYRGCRPGWLQVCNNPKAFLVFMCWFTTIQGLVVNGINNVNTTSVERRFNLPSSRVGLVSSAYDIAAGTTVILISYFRAHAHKPRLLSTAAFIMGCGSLVMSMPHFTTGLYQLRGTIADTCTGTGNSTACTVNPQNSYLQNYLYVLILGQLLHGVGGTTLYSLGTVFIDENVKTKVSPIYIGILYAFSALGPAIGYIVGGQFLNIYVDFENVNVENVNITPQDPRWVGAWWLGFVMAGFLAWTVTVALCAYPRELPTAKEVRLTRESQAHQDGGEDEVNRPGFGKSIRDMPTAAKVLLKNPTFVFVTLAGCTEGLVTSGFATFLPKLLQNQFGLTASWAAMLTGFVAVPGAAGGQLLGGIISSKLKLKVKGMLKLSMTACVMAALLAASFWISCETPSVFGVDIPYPNSTTVQVNNITAECNAGCGCTTSSFEPICLNGQEYFTPCHAGCLSSALVNGSKVYTDCSCIAEELGSNVSAAASIKTGRCTAECWTLYLFLPIALVLILFTFMSATPATSVTLRCIPDGQRAFGLGLQWVFIRFLGTVPGPILFGAIIDGTCQLWQQNCTENGSCWIYDSALMGRNFFFLGLGVKCLTALFFFLAHYCYKPPSTRKMVKSMTQQTLNVRKVSTFSSASQTSNNL